MNEQKTRSISFRIPENYYDGLQKIAKAFGMSQSEVLSESLDEYLNRKINMTQTAYLDRCAQYIGKGHSTKVLQAKLEAVLDGVTFEGLRTWSDRDLVPEEVFKQFVELKLKATAKAKKEKVAAQA